MLKTVDVLLGLSVVMLLVSLVVTVLTEAVANLLQLRGKHLLYGVIGLLRQVDRDLPDDVVRTIATKILTHPLIRAHGSRFGTVIHREELTKLVLELAADEGPERLDSDTLTKVRDMLRRNGIEDAEKTLEAVRGSALKLELSHPQLSNNMRYSTAFLVHANSRFLAKINGWFDQTIDRVSDRFTRATRIVTFCGSLLVALVLQLDTTQLVNRLSEDTNLRGDLVKQAVAANKENAHALMPQLGEPNKEHLRALVQDDVIEFPASVGEWTGRWNGHNFAMKFTGILLTAALLSLGAPFWYTALKNLIRLRSLIAQKDDEQRESRQTTQKPVVVVDQVQG